MTNRPYESIVEFCEGKLIEHGDSYLGVGWTKRQEDADTRYQVMLDVVRERPPQQVTILDLGCGLAHLLDYMQHQRIDHVHYSGLDVSSRYLSACRAKHPGVAFYERDILGDGAELPRFDYIIMNGVFTAKCKLSQSEMLEYFEAMLVAAYALARHGVAFNVMSTLVDWQRDDLFHLPLDMLSSIVARRLSRHFVIRHDYRLYEYTTYVYR